MAPERSRGLFVGLATLDVISRVDAPPTPNQKITANAQFVAAGGPAANAAVTFAALGGEATLLTALGSGAIAGAIIAELESVGVRVIDTAPGLADSAPVSSVTVIESTGERAVIGSDAAGIDVPAPNRDLFETALAAASVVLVDGHHPNLAHAVLAAAGSRPVILDAGRWKSAMAGLIERATDVVASADFRTPGTSTISETAESLIAAEVPVLIVTAGGDPVRWWSAGGHESVPVPPVTAVDTLGAGDVFHGAYAYARTQDVPIERRIEFANRVATVRCASIGPRSWLDDAARIELSKEES